LVRRHLAPTAVDEIAAALVEIRGDKDFCDRIGRLVHVLRMISGEGILRRLTPRPLRAACGAA